MLGAIYTAMTGRSPKWPAVRAAHLKAHPACAACGRRENLNVHHIRPFHLFPDLELAPSNFVTLCEWPTLNCHLWIGHGGDWSRWNPHVAGDAATVRLILANARAGT